MSTVQELINILQEYNPDAEFKVIIDCYPKNYDISFGTSEGCIKANADQVMISVDISDNNIEASS